jgi:hypothetical protein
MLSAAQPTSGSSCPTTELATAAVTTRHQHHERPLRVFVGKDGFSENHAWSEMPQHWPSCLAGRAMIEAVGQGQLEARLVNAGPTVDVVTKACGDPQPSTRVWVPLTEAVEGGWSLLGHAHTNSELVAAAARKSLRLHLRRTEPCEATLSRGHRGQAGARKDRRY